MKAALLIFWDFGRLCANGSLSTQALALWFTCAALSQRLPTGGLTPLLCLDQHLVQHLAPVAMQIPWQGFELV
jgi:hypothetical protein